MISVVSSSDIVLASHLRPLDKKDRFDGKWKQPWNVLSEKSTDGQEKTKQPPKQVGKSFSQRTFCHSDKNLIL